ncbi:discoidin domain-containing protein [Paenibacillus roseipurpureus]|uniref:Discoidin domain-containing protein n=1 Tax=Paenibacillus roseopurpureus TaxID=2918901 RepID=A0AA96RM91_9BACL|nr:discoidin domain-containing protein [Paenibacillus sp. MBLB1832]WNR46221.1 discoidin domain-containing protein [Paenibacillus sp. MBLB1832]
MRILKKISSSISMAAIVLSLWNPGVSHAATPITDANSSIFGPNVYVFDPDMPAADIQSAASAVFVRQESNEFGTERDAFLFKPGTYNVNIFVGFNTQASGLGQNPDDVLINGGLNVNADWDNGNATRNFWRGIENLSINPTFNYTPPAPAHFSAGTTQIAVSQAAPLRRLHIKGKLNLFDFDSGWGAGWASGGFLADSKVDGQVIPASQQQWFSRNSEWASWSNGVWNMVFVGDKNTPTGQFPDPPYTVVPNTSLMREKPYLYLDNTNQYQVFVPSLSQNTQGTSWANGPTPGTSIPISQFHIVRADQPSTSSAASINAALADGKNLLFTPGIYPLNDTIRINNANTVVLGIGMPTLIPTTDKPAMKVADVDGVKLAGLLFEAGPNETSSLVEVGPAGSSADHAANPTSLHDLFFRTGGAVVGENLAQMTINSDDVIGDHFWMWRADHGAGAGWTDNVSKNGLVVNGDDVTLYGLFNEHHNEYQTLWNGNGGRVYFYQSEIPYDVPNQAAWMDGSKKGFASYKVADSVTTHEAWGLGVYSYFRDAAVKLDNAIEVPIAAGVKIHHATTIWLNGTAGSEITHIVNGVGGRVYGTSGSAQRQTINFYGTDVGDTEAPSVPTTLVAKETAYDRVKIGWNASTDNLNVASYDVYRDGTLIGHTTTTEYLDMGVQPKATYSYTVKAVDGGGNQSAFSSSLSVTTPKRALDRSTWTGTSTSADPVSRLLDGDMGTRWSSGKPMSPSPEQSFTIDMKVPTTLNGIEMDSTGSNNDYARGYAVYVSMDGVTWGSPIATGTGTNKIITVEFAPQVARYLKVVQTGTNSSWWSVHEVRAYGLLPATASIDGPSMVTSGQTFDTTVSLANVVSAVYAQDIRFTYDTSLLEFVSVDFVNPAISKVGQSDTAGQLRFLTANLSQANVNGPLLTLHWRAKAPADNASTTITLTSLALADLQTATGLGPDSQVVLIKAIVDLTILNDKITAAQSIYDGAVEGYANGQYAPGSKTALLSAISTARAVVANPDVTRAQVADAIADLQEALNLFATMKYVGDPGDVNNDGNFTVVDLANVVAAYGKTSADSDWAQFAKADFNKDGKVDLVDLAAVAQRILAE